MPHWLRRPIVVLAATIVLAACGGSDEPDDDVDVTDDTSRTGDTGRPIDTGADTGTDTDPGDAGSDSGSDASDAGPDDTSDVSDADDASDASDASDADDASDATDASDASDADDASDASDASDADDASDASDADDASDTGDTGGPTVDWCRLHFPGDLTAAAGSTFTSYGRVFAGGITTRTTGTDVVDGFVAEIGVGPDGATPDDTWTWTPAEPNAGWADDDEPGNDEYQADVTVPEPGEYDMAWRFSADDGGAWLYCDRRVGDSDGAADGYQAANAGRLVASDPCEGACTVPPAPECVDATTLRTWSDTAVCTAVDGEPSCEWAPIDTTCDDGFECMAGACVESIDPPSFPGDIVVTEVMARSVAGDDVGEWIELYNASGVPLDLEGCTIGDDGGPDDTIDIALVVPVEGYVVLAASDDPSDTGGFAPDWEWSRFALANGGDEIILTCGGTTIDRVAYGASDVRLATSLQLANDRLDADSNDDIENWCAATDAYGDADRLGTPGTANGDCRLPVYPVGWCRLQFPDVIVGPPGTTEPVFVRAFVDGVTTRTPGTDVDDQVVVQIGVGPDGTDPTSTAGDLWTWVDADATPGWNDAEAGEPGNDEYTAPLTTPDAPGETRRFAGRVSGDGGETWSYCDRNVGTGSDGLADGFQPDNAGVMTIEFPVTGACEPNPCTSPPADECDSATVLKRYEALGSCEEIESVAVCLYGDTIVDCADDGGICVEGACVTGTLVPAVGELVITELMPRSRAGVGDDGEFVEVLNASATTYDLGGCSLGELEAAQWAIPPGTVVAPGERVVFAASDVPADNGGIVGAIAWTGFALSNGGDEVVIRCGDPAEIIDAVTYADSDVTLGISRQLDASKETALDNDLGENWCPTPVAAEGYDYFGTPGLPNLTCGGAAELTVDWCRLQFPLSIEGAEDDIVTVYGRVFIEGLTDATSGPDRVLPVRGELGFGPDGTDPATDDGWIWIDGTANDGFSDASNDEYFVNLELPSLGEYDYAWRFTANAGGDWLYCDGNEAGAADGYDIADAGALTVIDGGGVCDDVVCDTPPDDSCDGPTNAIVYDGVGTCLDDSVEAICIYDRTAIDCAATGQICLDGACVFDEAEPTPLPGEVVVTEIMPRAFAGTGDPGEFVELQNVAETPVSLSGCTLGDADGGEWTIPGGTILEPGAFVVFASSASSTSNGGLPDPIEWSGMGLSNSGEQIVLRCGVAETIVDVAEWTAGDVELGVAISLDPAATRADLNDDPNQWCASPGPVGTSPYTLTGTPGEPNPICPFEPLTVGWCAIQFPPEVTGAPGEVVDMYGVVWIEGLTDLSFDADRASWAWGEWGYGPDGSTPDAAPEDWTWTRGAPNDIFDDASNDEYLWSPSLPDAGVYDYAWRFTADHGATWSYCDNSPAGLADGYAPADAGAMTVE